MTVKPGQVWAAGAHLVACMSSTEPATLDLLFAEEAPCAVFADPPYGIRVVKPNGTSGGTIGGDSPDRAGRMVKANVYPPVIGDETTETARAAFALAHGRFPNATHVWWGGNYYADALPPSRCWLVWDKENTGTFADAELAWTNQDRGVRLFRHMWNGICKASERGQKRCHPTQKPVALAEWVYGKVAPQASLIFDPFLGSGPTLLAAQRQGRRVYGCELSPDYCRVALSRWEAETGQKAVRLH